jgi:SAM-dependent methyltransferase
VTLQAPAERAAAALHEGGVYVDPPGPTDRLLEPLRRLAEADRMRRLRSLEPGARVLEIGAGDGRFVARMREAGLDARGAEPSPAARSRARTHGVELVAEASADPHSQDAVVLWHVLEHLPDPSATLEQARSWLRAGGLLLVAVPNLDSVQAAIGGDRWFHQDVPRHRTHLTARGLRLLLERAGFAPQRISHLVVEQNALGMWQTLLNRITREPNVAFRLLKRDPGLTRARARGDIALTALLALPLAVVAPLLELAAGLARRGGSVVALARPAAAEEAGA